MKQSVLQDLFQKQFWRVLSIIPCYGYPHSSQATWDSHIIREKRGIHSIYKILLFFIFYNIHKLIIAS